MRWRYFGRVHPPDSEEGLFTVDYVVDAEWGLIRYRLMDQSGTSIVATPATGGIEVVTGRPGNERTETVPGPPRSRRPLPARCSSWSASQCVGRERCGRHRDPERRRARGPDRWEARRLGTLRRSSVPRTRCG